MGDLMELHSHPLKAVIWIAVLGERNGGGWRMEVHSCPTPVPQHTHMVAWAKETMQNQRWSAVLGTLGIKVKWPALPSLSTNKVTRSTSFGQGISSWCSSRWMCQAQLLQSGSTAAAVKGAASSPGLASS